LSLIVALLKRLLKLPSLLVPRLVPAMRRVPAKLWFRLGGLVSLVFVGLCLLLFTPLGDFLTKENIIALLEDLRTSPWTPLALILSYAVVAPFAVIPASPMLVGGGVVFGAFWGSLYNCIGLVLGSMAGYGVGRVLGREFVVQMVGSHLKRIERVFERQGFWPLVQVRFLPIPFAVVNYGAALAGVKPLRFLITSTLGLLPATLVHTYFASTLIFDPDPFIFMAYICTLLVLNVITGWPSIRERLRRRRRYGELLEERRSRVA
jgi:uncharacterized membrane protein YdjX (TVP38/TMEM64 family)